MNDSSSDIRVSVDGRRGRHDPRQWRQHADGVRIGHEKVIG